MRLFELNKYISLVLHHYTYMKKIRQWLAILNASVASHATICEYTLVLLVLAAMTVLNQNSIGVQ